MPTHKLTSPSHTIFCLSFIGSLLAIYWSDDIFVEKCAQKKGVHRFGLCTHSITTRSYNHNRRTFPNKINKQIPSTENQKRNTTQNHEYDNRKKADPTLCLYAGINLIYVTNNKDMEQDPPRGNRTVVKFISAKIKQNANSHKWKDYNGRKVWTVNAKEVEYITIEKIFSVQKTEFI